MTMTIRLTRTIGFEDTNTIGYYSLDLSFVSQPDLSPQSNALPVPGSVLSVAVWRHDRCGRSVDRSWRRCTPTAAQQEDR